MRHALALALLALLLCLAIGTILVRLRRARIEREYRRGHGDYSRVRHPGDGWLG